MGRSPGVQLRRAFMVGMGLALLMTAGALASSLAVSRSLRTFAQREVPYAAATAAVERSILAAEASLLRYLSERADDTSAAADQLTKLNRQLSHAIGTAPSPEAVAELDKIGKGVERFRKVLLLMPRSPGPSRDWSRVQEHRQTAIDLGKSLEERAARLARGARDEVRTRSHWAYLAAAVASAFSAAVIAAMAISALALRRRWERFQEQLLGL